MVRRWPRVHQEPHDGYRLVARVDCTVGALPRQARPKLRIPARGCAVSWSRICCRTHPGLAGPSPGCWLRWRAVAGPDQCARPETQTRAQPWGGEALRRRAWGLWPTERAKPIQTTPLLRAPSSSQGRTTLSRAEHSMAGSPHLPEAAILPSPAASLLRAVGSAACCWPRPIAHLGRVWALSVVKSSSSWLGPARGRLLSSPRAMS